MTENNGGRPGAAAAPPKPPGGLLALGALFSMPFWALPLALPADVKAAWDKEGRLMLLEACQLGVLFALAWRKAGASGFLDGVKKGLVLGAVPFAATLFTVLEVLTDGPRDFIEVVFYQAVPFALLGGPVAGALAGYVFRGQGRPGEPAPVGAAVPAAEEFSPEERESVVSVYGALRGSGLFDLYTARAYRAREGAGQPQAREELEKRYAGALAGLQEARPGFTAEEWDRCNARIHGLVRLAFSRGAGAGPPGSELSSRYPWLGEEFLNWILRSARLFD